MHRTQLYLDDDLWTVLHARARKEGTSISELVRTAARERYIDSPERRIAAMQAIVGLWKDRTDLPETEDYIRNLRNDDRMERLGSK